MSPVYHNGCKSVMTALTDDQQIPAAKFDAVAEAKLLLRSTRAAALATLAAPSGDPFASLVNVATAPDGSPILLMSRLAAHTRHLDIDSRVSLLFYSALNMPSGGDPLTHSRLTILGRAKRVERFGRAPGAACEISRAASEIEPLCRFRRFFVFPSHNGGGASQRRIWACCAFFRRFDFSHPSTAPLNSSRKKPGSSQRSRAPSRRSRMRSLQPGAAAATRGARSASIRKALMRATGKDSSASFFRRGLQVPRSCGRRSQFSLPRPS